MSQLFPDRLEEVLFLNGPAELQTFVCDVAQEYREIVSSTWGRVLYQIKHGPIGWHATAVAWNGKPWPK